MSRSRLQIFEYATVKVSLEDGTVYESKLEFPPNKNLIYIHLRTSDDYQSIFPKKLGEYGEKYFGFEKIYRITREGIFKGEDALNLNDMRVLLILIRNKLRGNPLASLMRNIYRQYLLIRRSQALPCMPQMINVCNIMCHGLFNYEKEVWTTQNLCETYDIELQKITVEVKLHKKTWADHLKELHGIT